MPQRPPWTWGRAAIGRRREEDLLSFSAYLNERMADLQSYLEVLHREVSFGPVAGSYFPVVLGRSTNTGTALPATLVDLFSFGWEMRPVSVSAVCFFGNLTMDVLSGGSSILTAGPISLLDGVAQVLNSRGDFLVEKVTGDLSLDIVSIDGATVPEHVRVTVMNKNLSKVEPA